jgi:hypothetical protein
MAFIVAVTLCRGSLPPVLEEFVAVFDDIRPGEVDRELKLASPATVIERHATN